jgi:hypothetical protein
VEQTRSVVVGAPGHLSIVWLPVGEADVGAGRSEDAADGGADALPPTCAGDDRDPASEVAAVVLHG